MGQEAGQWLPGAVFERRHGRGGVPEERHHQRGAQRHHEGLQEFDVDRERGRNDAEAVRDRFRAAEQAEG